MKPILHNLLMPVSRRPVGVDPAAVPASACGAAMDGHMPWSVLALASPTVLRDAPTATGKAGIGNTRYQAKAPGGEQDNGNTRNTVDLPEAGS